MLTQQLPIDRTTQRKMLQKEPQRKASGAHHELLRRNHIATVGEHSGSGGAAVGGGHECIRPVAGLQHGDETSVVGRAAQQVCHAGVHPLRVARGQRGSLLAHQPIAIHKRDQRRRLALAHFIDDNRNRDAAGLHNGQLKELAAQVDRQQRTSRRRHQQHQAQPRQQRASTLPPHGSRLQSDLQSKKQQCKRMRPIQTSLEGVSIAARSPRPANATQRLQRAVIK
jgi:hypothetical protein